MRNLTADDFEEKTGTVYEVSVQDALFPLTLTSFQPLTGSGREGGSFRLEFRGPAEPILAQAIYPFRGGGEELDIFIVPTGRDQDGTRYEAVFF
ncbi:MAG TPA: hypothetical protein VH331_00980 [Allosphingosinicella sp.]|jgi:hypothetical protein|nr:hypothetical protein [Allosphingosinicella sp.]